ncbi:MAG: hypothetical protein QNJ44_22650 [Rhodobacter sp.]|nr:hypothetical protein [Rhodobacter sp.]
MAEIRTIRELVNLWPTRAELARDISAVSPLIEATTHQVHKWAENGSIPSKYQSAVLRAATERGFPVTAELLITLHSPREDAA